MYPNESEIKNIIENAQKMISSIAPSPDGDKIISELDEAYSQNDPALFRIKLQELDSVSNLSLHNADGLITIFTFDLLVSDGFYAKQIIDYLTPQKKTELSCYLKSQLITCFFHLYNTPLANTLLNLSREQQQILLYALEKAAIFLSQNYVKGSFKQVEIETRMLGLGLARNVYANESQPSDLDKNLELFKELNAILNPDGKVPVSGVSIYRVLSILNVRDFYPYLFNIKKYSSLENKENEENASSYYLLTEQLYLLLASMAPPKVESLTRKDIENLKMFISFTLYLQQKSDIYSLLKPLEASLSKYLKREAFTSGDFIELGGAIYPKIDQSKRSCDYPKQHGLLAHLLKLIFMQPGIQIPCYQALEFNPFAIFCGFVPPELADEQVSKYGLFLEFMTDLGPLHGKYSHPLQWVMLSVLAQNKLVNLYGNTLYDFLKVVVSSDYFKDKSEMWGYLVDTGVTLRDGTIAQTATTPYSVMNSLLTENSKLPLLSSYIYNSYSRQITKYLERFKVQLTEYLVLQRANVPNFGGFPRLLRTSEAEQQFIKDYTNRDEIKILQQHKGQNIIILKKQAKKTTEVYPKLKKEVVDLNLDEATARQLQKTQITQLTMLYGLACEKNNFFVMKLLFELLHEHNAIDTNKVPLATLLAWAVKNKEDALRDQIAAYHLIPVKKSEEARDRRRNSLYFSYGEQEKRVPHLEEDSDSKEEAVMGDESDLSASTSPL